jgi:hypothetical protein
MAVVDGREALVVVLVDKVGEYKEGSTTSERSSLAVAKSNNTLYYIHCTPSILVRTTKQ